METIPTAEEYLRNNNYNLFATSPFTEMMIEFAKLHVTEALKQAYSNSKIYLKTIFTDIELITEEESVYWGGSSPDDSYSTLVKVDKDSILNAYSLDNIK